MTHKEKIPKQIGMARLLKCEGIQDVTKIKYVNNYKALIQFSKDSSADKLMQNEKLIEKGFHFTKTFETGISYGIVRNIDLEFTKEEIFESISSKINIINVKRLNKRGGNGWEPSEVVRVGFEGPTLPTHIFIDDIRSEVEKYVHPVTQCSHCWRFGHHLKICPRNQIVCPKCGDNHANCATTDYKCVNCKGSHMALAKVCPVYLKEKNIRELMSEYNCSYKRALTLYVPPSPLPQSYQTGHHEETELADDNTSTHVYAPTPGTYAQVVKTSAQIHQNINQTPQKAEKTQKNRKSKKNKKRHNENEEWIGASESDEHTYSSRDSQSKEDNQKNTEKRGRFINMLRDLIVKLKDVIFSNELTGDKKLSTSVKILFDWVLITAIKYLSDWPFFKTILSVNG
ncbi:unnamed protein product [Plutella xylostella]|uniref:(diamondback moth) hypothetical protein n=1 Tax=Plutella xylostella TaxID=51655 RepID=A0A8S4GDM3_PLUXY|nr:unnamed protein product [Plutella xylostella]